MNPPVYYPKITGIDGTVIAAPLDVASVAFIEASFVAGQHRLGECVLTLKNTRGNKYLRSLYSTLLQRQRVEIYDNIDLLGDPVFSGVLTRLTRDTAGNREWRGNSYEDWLDHRHVPQFTQVTGNAMTALQGFLGTYNVTFKDDFNRAAIGADWTLTDCALVSNCLEFNATPAAVAETVATYTATQYQNAEVSFDYFISDQTAGDILFLIGATTVFDLGTTFSGLGNTEIGFGVTNYRIVNLLFDAWNHVSLRVESVTATTAKITCRINGLEMIYETITVPTGASVLKFQVVAAGGSDYVRIDNFIFAPKTTILTAGDLDSTTDTIDQQFNGDSYLSIIEWICEKEGWMYRIRPKAGAGNDLIDVGASIGTYWTGLTLEDGSTETGIANIERLNIDESNEELATELTTYGQSRDDALSSFVSVNLSAMDTYGILEGEYHDERVQDSAIAKAVGDARLTRLSAGNISIQGRIIDESGLLRQDPKVGYAVVGDFVLGGRDRFRAGDTIPLKSDDQNLNQTVEFVSITRKSGDNGIDVVFDYHMYRRSDDERKLRREVAQLQRALNQRMDTQSLVFALSGTTAQEISFNVRGNLYKAVYLDVTSAAWAGNITFKIDTVDRTSALFGAANLSANSFASDTTYLIYSGVHTITLTPTQTVTITVGIRPVLYG
jgi:hypothetical protein